MTTEIFPKLRSVSEKDAQGEIAAIYESTKEVLGIPWTAAIFQGYATYPPLLRLAWLDLRPSAATLGIRELLETFNYGNSKLLLCATAVTLSLEGRPVAGTGELEPSTPQPAEAAMRKRTVTMVDSTQPPEDVAPIFEDIKRTLRLPLVNSDLPRPRELARVPAERMGRSQADGWQSRLPAGARCAGASRQRGRRRFRRAHSALGSSPCPRRVPENEIDNVVRVAQLFSGLLPGLILNVAGFQRALRG